MSLSIQSIYIPLIYTSFGALLSLLIGLLLYYLNQKKDDRAKIYAPLLTEMINNLKELESFSPNLTDNEWHRIDQEEHLSYGIKPKKLKLKFNNFYNEEIRNYINIINLARRKIDKIIINELDKKALEDQDYHLQTHQIIEHLLSPILNGKSPKEGDLNYGFLNQQFENVNGQLRDKFKDFQEFCDIIMKLSNKESEVENARNKREKITNEINAIVLDLNKKLNSIFDTMRF